MSESTLFARLERKLRPGQVVRIEIERRENDLSVLVIPILPDSRQMPEEGSQERALASRPFFAQATAAELDADFAAVLEEYLDARERLDALCREQIAAVKADSTKATTKGGAKTDRKNTAEKSESAPETTEAAEGSPESL